RHTSFSRDWSSDVCSSDLGVPDVPAVQLRYRMRNVRNIRNTPGRGREGRGTRAPVVTAVVAVAAVAVGVAVAGGGPVERPGRPEIGRASCRERGRQGGDAR